MTIFSRDKSPELRLAVPSDGALHEPALMFLQACGMGVSRTNLRRYTADIPTLPGVTVLFQRSSDISLKVEEGSADMGMVGLDRVLETRSDVSDTNIVIENLGFGHSQLVIGVPDSWMDVTSLADLAELSMEFREQGGDLRIATKYPRLVERFLAGSGVNYFSLVQSSGTLEAAPAMGFTDIIADISSTGTTLRENRLKTIQGGAIFSSQACLISNKVLLANHQEKLGRANILVEMIESHLQSRDYYSLTANMKGESAEEVASYVLEQPNVSGLTGPTISPVHTRDGQKWYAVTVIIEKGNLLSAVEHFRNVGGSSITVSQPNYVFQAESEAHARLI